MANLALDHLGLAEGAINALRKPNLAVGVHVRNITRAVSGALGKIVRTPVIDEAAQALYDAAETYGRRHDLTGATVDANARAEDAERLDAIFAAYRRLHDLIAIAQPNREALILGGEAPRS